jgi:hypothetical protein
MLIFCFTPTYITEHADISFCILYLYISIDFRFYECGSRKHQEVLSAGKNIWTSEKMK